MRVRDYDDFLDEIHEAIIEDTICESDIIKVIRKTTSVLSNYYPIAEYYFEEDECDEDYEEILVSDLIMEIKRYMNVV